MIDGLNERTDEMKDGDLTILRAVVEAAGSCADSLRQIERWEKLLESGRCNLLLECDASTVDMPEPLYHLNEPHPLPGVVLLEHEKAELLALLFCRKKRLEDHLAAMKVRVG